MTHDASRRWAATGLVALSLLANGCASIIHGTRQNISISSQPTGANVFVDGAASGNAPMTILLKRKQDHLVRLELSGYQPYEMKLEHGFSGWYLGNIVIGGIIGLIVDAADGAMYKLTPKQLNAVLQASAAPVADASPTGASSVISRQGDRLYIAVTMHTDPAWQRIGTLQRLPAPPPAAN